MTTLAQNKITYLNSVTNHAAFSELSLSAALEAIQQGTYQRQVEGLPGLNKTNKASYRAKKATLPVYAFHGTFQENVDAKHFVLSSELVALDIDGLDRYTLESTKAKLTADKTVAAVFVSPSGEGLKALIRVPKDFIKDDASYKTAFKQISELWQLKGITVDPTGKDVSRLCFVAFDPDIYINYEPETLRLQEATTNVIPINTAPTTPRPTVASPKDAEHCLNKIIAKMATATPGTCHDTRLRVGRLAGGYIAAGRISEADATTALRIASDSIGETTPTEWKTILDAIEYGKEAPIYEGWEEDYKNHVDLYNDTHAHVIVGGKHRIMRTVPATASPLNRESYEFIPQETLVAIDQMNFIKTGEKQLAKGRTEDIYTNRFLAWAKHPTCRVYSQGVIFAPEAEVPEGFFNTWKGLAVKPTENPELLNEIHRHIQEVVCGGHETLIDYFYDWIAYTLQRPEMPVGAALVLRGQKGSGKGVVGHFLANIWGHHSLYIASSKHLVGSFNGHLVDVCFLFADEAFFSGDKAHEGVLKSIITEPFLMIERKGVDAIKAPNYLKVFMVTNEDFAVPATKDERRFGIYDVSNKYVGDNTYFDKLTTCAKDVNVQAAFLFEMLARDITKFRPGNIPESEGLRDQRSYTLPAHGKWLMDCLTQGCFGHEDAIGKAAIWTEENSFQYLLTKYLEWCKNQRIGTHELVSLKRLGKYLREMYTPKQVSQHRLAGVRFGTWDEAIEAFEKHEKVTIDKQ